MGLDIIAYELLERAPEEEGLEEASDVGDKDPPLVYLFQPEKFMSLTEGLAPGIYKSRGEEISFRVGSYSYYEWWRNELALMILGKPAESVRKAIDTGPFAELICFTEYDGYFGPRTCSKLASDFDRHELEILNKLDDADDADEVLNHFPVVYADLLAAFKLASTAGAVVFC